MRPSQLSFAFLGSAALAIFALQWWQQASYLPVQLWLCLWLLVGLLCRRRRLGQGLVALCLGGLLATWSVARTHHQPTPQTIDFYADSEQVTLRGWIAAEPDRRPLQTKYTVSVQELQTASGTVLPVTGRVLATDYSFWPQYEYGAAISVRGTLEKPAEIDGFRYDHYLSRYGIYAVIYRGSFAARETPFQGSRLLAVLFRTKAKFEAQINRLYPEPHASFMAGLITGSRRGIPEHLLKSFERTGLTHIIAISGYNISIVVVIIGHLLFWLPLRWRLLPAIGAIVAFTLFVGASAAVVRAAIMGILGLLALHTHRISHARLSVLWTLVIMTAWNPKQLWYDAGFQLSFLAVLGLMEVGPYLERPLRWLPQTLGLREAVQMTLAAQITAVPWIVMLFGRLSLIAPVANLLAAPFIPPAMLLGFISTLLSVVTFPFGQIVAYIGWTCLEWIVQTANLLAQVPLASVPAQLTIPFLLLYYAALVLTLWLVSGSIRTQRYTASAR